LVTCRHTLPYTTLFRSRAQPVRAQEVRAEGTGQAEVRVQQRLEGDAGGRRREQQRQEVQHREGLAVALVAGHEGAQQQAERELQDRKSTRLNSSHVKIS